MIQSVTVVNHESKTFEFLLNDISESGLYISNIEGLGYPSSTISSSETFNNAVSIYSNTVKQPRNIVITFGISEFGFNTVEQARELIYIMFPSMTELYMEFESDEKILNITGYVENITPIIFDQKESVQVSIICPNHYFYSGGKISISSEDIFDYFQFTEWFEQLIVSDHLGQEIYALMKPPISELYPDNEFYRWVKGYSRFKNPTGFEIILKREKDEEMDLIRSFNSFTLEYDDGVIVSDSKGIPYSEFAIGDYNLTKNRFVNVNILLTNDYEDQDIYEVDENGNKTSILKEVIIDGDFPVFKVGYNIIKSKLMGVIKVETEERFMLDSDVARYHHPDQYHNRAWEVLIPENSYYMEIDMLINSTREYIGHLTVTSDTLPEVESTLPIHPDIDQEGNPHEVVSYYKIPTYSLNSENIKDHYSAGIYMTRSDKKQNNPNEYKEGDYYYTIWFKIGYKMTYYEYNNVLDYVAEKPTGKIYTLNVEIKDVQVPNILEKMYKEFKSDAHSVSSTSIGFRFVLYRKLSNPLNLKSYVYEYGNIENHNIIVRYDEMFDAF